MIEGSSNFMSGSSSWYFFIVFQLIKQDYVIKGSGYYNDRTPTSLVVKGIVVLAGHVISQDHVI